MSGSRLLAGAGPAGIADLAAHLDIHGPAPGLGKSDAPALADALRRAGLRGRGGAGFPAGTKLTAVAAEGGRAVVVANGAESEPMSRKDRHLMARAPHLVLDGLELAAAALGARNGVLVAPGDLHPSLRAALAQRGRQGGRGRVAIDLTAPAPGYVGGEETALLAHLEGRPALPRVTPPRPAERGLRGRPTLVQNVETLAHLALIARHGPAWFRTAGTPGRPGTMLVTVGGAVRNPGVLEVESGAPLADVIERAGGASEPARAVLVGGYFGTWVRGGGGRLRLDEESLAPVGATPGAGVVVVLPRSACGVAESARLADWLSRSSAGQCGPCVHGLSSLAALLGRVAAGATVKGDGARLSRWLELVPERGACHHPDGAVRMIRSVQSTFGKEMTAHAREGACRSCARPSHLVLPGTGSSA